MQARAIELTRPFVTGLLILLVRVCFSQTSVTFSVHVTADKCTGGSATLQVAGAEPHDKIQITWSNGQLDRYSVKSLESGPYWVQVTVTATQDTLQFVTDTLLNFDVGKDLCPVGVPKYFSPNGDGYHDELQLSEIEEHPNFDLQIYNKWGQIVHKQKKKYVPWQGDWNGVPLPDGSYFYILIYDAEDPHTLQKGDITILR